MRRLLTTGLAVAFVLFGGVALAGDYHDGASLICSDCHVMHYSQSHGYNPDGSGFSVLMGGSGPYEYLLRNEVNALCLTCHDGSPFAHDVLGAQTGSVVRQGGALNEDGGGFEATGHTLGSMDDAPGSSPAWSSDHGLNCIDCHHQHGYNPNGNSYRNLKYNPGNVGFPGLIVTYSIGTNDPLTDVYEVAANDVGVDDVFFNEPDPTGSAYAEWCAGCHTEFHGAKGGAEVGGATGEKWHRHPNADANIGSLGGGHSNAGLYAAATNKVKTMSETGIWDSTDPLDLAGATPSCFSCHKAHGNNNAFGLIFMSGTGTVTEEGDDGTVAKDLCSQCHVQG